MLTKFYNFADKAKISLNRTLPRDLTSWIYKKCVLPRGEASVSIHTSLLLIKEHIAYTYRRLQQPEEKQHKKISCIPQSIS